jgi:dTDP-4-amino-4,6-dideoxygalactose transaminase
MTIRQFDLSRQHALLQDRFAAASQRVMSSGRFVLGAELDAFEHELADYLGGGHVVGVNSGSDALRLALHLHDIRPGDEVVLPSYTFRATLEAVLHAQATPKFVDCGEDGFNCEPEQILRALSGRTRALIIVHLFGLPVVVDDIRRECRKRGVAVIEDTAQALGASTAHGKAGTRGDAGCFSFYPTKQLGALGDGGAIWVAEAKQAQRLRGLRNHGEQQGRLLETGFNSRLDELQAALLRVKLAHLDAWIEARQALAQRYRDALRGSGFLVREANRAEHCFNQFTILHPERDRLRAWLHDHGVETRVYYDHPAHLHPAIHSPPTLPVAESRARQALALPMYPELEMTTVDRVCALIGALPAKQAA